MDIYYTVKIGDFYLGEFKKHNSKWSSFYIGPISFATFKVLTFSPVKQRNKNT